MVKQYDNQTADTRLNGALRTPPSEIGALEQAITQAVEALVRQAQALPISGVQVAEVRQLLAALPLAKDAYAVALNRLANAHAYSARGEDGAARFELRLLLAGVVNGNGK